MADAIDVVFGREALYNSAISEEKAGGMISNMKDNMHVNIGHI